MYKYWFIIIVVKEIFIAENVTWSTEIPIGMTSKGRPDAVRTRERYSSISLYTYSLLQKLVPLLLL